MQGNCQNSSVHDHVCNLKNSCHVNGQTCSVKSKTEKKVHVAWPQDLAFVGTLRKRPSYEELTMTQWLLGFLRIAEEERDQVKKQNMYAYLTELMQDTADNSWAAAKGAHAVLMYRIQDGVLDWRDLEKIQKIRQTYARSVVHNSGDSNAKRGSGNGVPCRNFQSGSCGFPGNHEINGLFVKHVCAHCLNTMGKEFKHPRKDCNKFKLMNSKNRKPVVDSKIQVSQQGGLNVVVERTVNVSQSNSNVVVHVDNSLISTSGAILPLVSENPGKSAVAPSGAISNPFPWNNVLPRAKVHLGFAESSYDGALEQTCKQSNRSNRKVIDWSQLRCNSNSNRLKFFKCNSNRLKFYLLHLLLSIIFLLQFTLCYFSEGGCRKMIT